MAYIRSGNPRDIIIVYVETIPTLTFTSWYPGQPRNSVVSTSQSEFSEDPASQSDICIDTTNCMPQSSINIDQYIIKDKHRHMEFKQRGTLPSLSDKSDSTSDATEVDYTDSYSDMSASELWELPLNQPQDQQNLPNFDIVIEDYSKLSDFEKSVTDLNHNNMKCIDTLDYGDTKNKWKEDTIPEHVDKSYDVVTNLFEPPLQKTELHVTTTTTTTNNLSAGEKESADSLSPNDLEKLKLIATRLNLQTRRGSYTTWRNKLAQVTSDKNIKADQSSETEYTKEDKPDTSNQSDEEKLRMKPRSIAESLAFIKSELVGSILYKTMIKII